MNTEKTTITSHAGDARHETWMTPQYFFLTLGTLIALVTVSVSFINLIFETLNQAYPDVLNATYQYGYSSYNFEGIRTTLATVIIFFPVYLTLSHFWAKDSRQNLSTHNNTLRKWALYIILFLIILTVAVDLVTLVRYFISGELTTRFLLKVGSVFLITGTLFGYYFKELKRDALMFLRSRFFFAIVAVIFVLGGVVYSFSVIGTPNNQRALRLDQKRIEDLQNIQSQVITYWQQREKLPAQLIDLIDPLNSWQVIPKDPEFQKGVNYEYTKINDLEFQLCATFSKPIPQGWQENSGARPYSGIVSDADISMGFIGNISGYAGTQNENWGHNAGRTCFSRKIDKEIYPPLKENQQVKSV